MSFLGKIGKTFYSNPVKSIGGLLGGGGGDPGKKQYAQILAAHDRVANQNKAAYANALYQQKQGLGAIKTGYGGALTALSTAGNAGRQDIVDREMRNTGALKAGLVSSGLGDTTTAANLQRGIYSDTSRNLSAHDAAVAQIRASLMAQQAGAEAGQYGALSGVLQGQAGMNAQLGQSLINSIGNVQYEDPGDWISQLLQLGGTAIGYGIGGPVGGAIGGQVGGNVQHWNG